MTEADESAARRAIAGRRARGRLIVVETRPTGSTAIADPISPRLGGPGHDRPVTVMPETLGVFADGALVEAPATAMP